MHHGMHADHTNQGQEKGEKNVSEEYYWKRGLTEGHWNLDRGTGTGRSAMGMVTLTPPAGGRPLLRDMSSTKVLVAATAAVQLLR